MTRHTTQPIDPELAATLERGRLAIETKHAILAAREIADFEARLRAAAPEVYGGCDMGADGGACDGCVCRERHAATAEDVEAQAPKLIAGLRASLDVNENKAAG